MLQVLRHAMGTSATYATRAAALAAGRFLARQLAAARALTGILEDPCDDGLLIYGTIQDETGKIIDVPLLVWVSFPSASFRGWAEREIGDHGRCGAGRRPACTPIPGSPPADGRSMREASMASAEISNQTRPEKPEHRDFWARQRARMADPAELRASAQRLGCWRRPPPEPSVSPGAPKPDADRLLATEFLTGGSTAGIGSS
jgi:hypothetical protein